MSSNETAAYDIMTELDVDYVLVIFGGVIGYSGDDINKFLWMVREMSSFGLNMSDNEIVMLFRYVSRRVNTRRTSRSLITSRREASSGWTARGAPPCSTASCTSSPTTGA